MQYNIEPIPENRQEINDLISDYWVSTRIVTRGRVHDASQLPGFIATCDKQLAGLITYHINRSECEIVSLNSLIEGAGIGIALIDTVHQFAMESGCRRIWLITTNDNLAALRFYQKRGFRLVAIYPGALEISRQLKPEIPVYGLDGIPLRDEIELEMLL